MAGFSPSTYAVVKNYIKKSLIGLGLLRGAPCTVDSVTPVYSALDPTEVISNKVILKYEGEPGRAATLDVAQRFYYQTVDILNGRGIHKVEYLNRDVDFFHYKITYLDGYEDEFTIPRVLDSTQMIVVPALPDIDIAREDAIYLLQPDQTKDEYIKYIKVLNQAGIAYEWLSLGSTNVDLAAYQKKIDDNIIKKTYKNYDSATKDANPNAANVVGAINEHEIVLGTGAYDYVNGVIPSLNTYHKDTVINVLNEIGDISNLEMWDATTQTPATLVDAINIANGDYNLVANTTIDKTKHVDTYKLTKDAKDGSIVAQVGDTVTVPRVDIKQDTTVDDGTFKDYRTYNLYMGNELTDAGDTSNTPFGAIHIPEIKIVKKVPTDTQPTSETFALTAADWSTTEPYTAVVRLSKTPYSVTSVMDGATPVPFTVSGKEVSLTTTTPVDMTVEVKYEVQTLASQYFLQIEGKPFSQALCGDTIDIAKDNLLKDIIIVKNTDNNTPVPGLLKDEKAIAFIFEDAAGVEKTTYLPVKDLLKAYEGKDGIEVDDTVDPQTSYISIKLYDPDAIEALKTDLNGLRIMRATQTQYGVVEYATNDEVLAPASTVEKVVRPIDVYTFVTESDSVKGDIGTLYTDPDSGEIVNNTITKAISELSTIKVEKKADALIDAKNIAEYVVNDIPVAGVKNILGDLVEVPKTVIQVTEISTIADPKSYILYYLTQTEEPYEEGLYEYIAPNWVKVSGGAAIVTVDKLPEAPDPIYDDRFYLVENTDTVDSRYTLSQAAIDAGYTIESDGIHYGTTINSFEAVMLDWLDWVNDELIESDTGILWKIANKDGVFRLEYGYQVFDSKLYYHNQNSWVLVCPPDRITMTDIFDLVIED